MTVAELEQEKSIERYVDGIDISGQCVDFKEIFKHEGREAMKKKKEDMNSISSHRLKTLMDKFFIKETKRRKDQNK